MNIIPPDNFRTQFSKADKTQVKANTDSNHRMQCKKSLLNKGLPLTDGVSWPSAYRSYGINVPVADGHNITAC